MKSAVQDDAGLKAKFDDVFILPNIMSSIGESIIIKAFDSDVVGQDPLGIASPITY